MPKKLAEHEKAKANNDLPALGNNIDYNPFWEQGDFKENLDRLGKTLQDIDRLAIQRNFDPEINRGLAMIPFLKKGIESGKLKFHAEAPGLNSDRYYFGFKYDF